MSYSKSYHQRIVVHYSGSVSYPASQNGGTAYYRGTEYEDVYVNINVDTNPFDRSIAYCNNNVNTLTGAVIATNAAQIASINNNAKKVANTLIDAFFKNIRFEISTQITELAQKIDAHLMHLRELSKQLLAKKTQMEVDYNRTANRYVKIFEDLNNELSNRIFELDRPAFSFKQLVDAHSQRATDNDMVSSVAVTGAEGANLQTCIGVSVCKKRALDAIRQANIFLTTKKRLQRTVNRSMLNDNTETTRFSPICFLETQNEKAQIDRSVYHSNCLSDTHEDSIIAGFQSKQWIAVPKESQEKIGRYFNAELGKAYSDVHTNRVRDMIVKMFDFNSIKCIQS
jgi:hypothetical protein